MRGFLFSLGLWYGNYLNAKQFQALAKTVSSGCWQTRSGRFNVSKGKEIHVRCMRCQELVPSSISFKDKKSFDMETLIKNRPACPRCGDMTSYDKKNICIRDESGEFVCIDIK